MQIEDYIVRTYVFVVEPWGFEVEVDSISEKQAHAVAFASLTAEEQDCCECLDLINILN
jgi:hypothetical protein